MFFSPFSDDLVSIRTSTFPSLCVLILDLMCCSRLKDVRILLNLSVAPESGLFLGTLKSPRIRSCPLSSKTSASGFGEICDKL